MDYSNSHAGNVDGEHLGEPSNQYDKATGQNMTVPHAAEDDKCDNNKEAMSEKQGVEHAADSDAETSDEKKEDLEKSDDDDDEPIEREGWDSKADFILAMIGYAVGLGNIWRFPYLCYKNGGGAFLIPYVICLIFLGIPAFYMEEAFGQYRQVGGLTVWNIIPYCKGCGYTAATIACMMNIYYIVIIAWIIIYLIFSFSPTLPWSICYGWWNDIYCFDSKTMNMTNNGTDYLTGEYGNITVSLDLAETPAEQYWNNFVLQISDGIHDLDGIVWYLALSLAGAWGLVYLCIWRGVRTTGKIVWFTTTFPYVVLTILLIRAVTLPGAEDGIYYYLYPDLSRLSDAQVWVDAASQIFFSLGIGFAGLISLGSYNDYNNNVLIDTLVVCIVNCCTSLYAGFMIFACLGFMAWEQGKEVSEVVDEGPGLVFIAVPTAIAEMPISNFWAICFFVMLLMLGLDSQFCVVEGFYTCLADEYPKLFRRHRSICLALLCVVYYLMALPCVTRGGMYIFTLMDGWGASGYVLLWSGMWESIAICYAWGYKPFLRGIADMLGHKPNILWPIHWAIVIPLGLIAIQLFSFITYDGAYYEEDYRYPLWGECLGWLMSAFSMHWVFSYVIYAFLVSPGTLKERWDTLREPVPGTIVRPLDTGEEELAYLKEEGVDSDAYAIGTYKSYENDLDTPCEDASNTNPGFQHEVTTEL